MKKYVIQNMMSKIRNLGIPKKRYVKTVSLTFEDYYSYNASDEEQCEVPFQKQS